VIKTAVGPLELKPNEFWILTPAEFNEMVAGYIERKKQESKDKVIDSLFLAWHVEAFQRTKKLPKLDSLISKIEGPKKPLDPNEMLNQIMSINAAFGGELIIKESELA